MKNMKGVVLIACAAAAGLAGQALAKNKTMDKNVPLDQVQFIAIPGVQGISQADLWGDSKKGPHGSMTKFAAGTKVGLHTHTAADKIIVVSGTMIFGDAAGKEVKLGPGSYRLEPAGFPHTTACAEGADCVIFDTQSGAFDLKMVEGKK